MSRWVCAACKKPVSKGVHCGRCAQPSVDEADVVNHPAHYNQGKIEVIEFIEDKKLGFHLGNAVKYIARAGKKDPQKYCEDLEKARWYIAREIELQEDKPRRPNEMNVGVGTE